MTTQQSPSGQAQALPYPMAGDRLYGIRRTGWIKPTRRWQRGRDHQLVEPYNLTDEMSGHRLAHVLRSDPQCSSVAGDHYGWPDRCHTYLSVFRPSMTKRLGC